MRHRPRRPWQTTSPCCQFTAEDAQMVVGERGSPPGLMTPSATVKDTNAEQVELRPDVHLSLNELQPRDLALRLAVAPGQSQCCIYRRQVPSKVLSEAAHLPDTARCCLREPHAKGPPVLLPDEPTEFLRDSVELLEDPVLLPECIKFCSLLVSQLVVRLHEQPCGVPR